MLGEIVDIDNLVIEYVSSRALLVKTDKGDEYWVPKSQIFPGGTLSDSSVKGDRGSLCIPQWLAIKKGMASE